VRNATLVISGVTLRTKIPESLAERRRGLLGEHELEAGTSMLFRRCRSVHTFGMRCPITVLVLDRNLRVLRVKTLPPNRLLLPTRKARHILECAAGISPPVGDRAELRLVGDELEEEEANEPSDDDTDRSRGNDHEGHDPADGARKRDGLAPSFGGPEAKDLEQQSHGVPSARTEARLREEDRGPRLYFRG
jgi:uncharacterized membrane protein (UPF0127 family)